MNMIKRTETPLVNRKIARCHRCWGSKNLYDMFECDDCGHSFCRTHEFVTLSGVFKCMECFSSNTSPKREDIKKLIGCYVTEVDGISNELQAIYNKITYAIPGSYTHDDVLWMLKLLRRIFK